MVESLVEEIEQLKQHRTQEENAAAWSAQYLLDIEQCKKIAVRLSMYRFEDACTAIFSINSWHQNRSAQTCALTLNAALLLADSFGDRTIVTYDEFEEFFSSIREMCTVSPYEDVVLPVMGHTKIPFGDRWYPAIYGCGMIQEYPRLCFVDEIADTAGRKDNFRSLLQYAEEVCDSLEGGGWEYSEPECIQFALPSCAHWDHTRYFFNTCAWQVLSEDVLKTLSYESSPIEMQHFICRNAITLPLFNPSILHDYLLDCCHVLGDEALDGVVDAKLSVTASSLYAAGAGRNSGCIMYPCFRFEKEFAKGCPCTFLTYDTSGAVTLFYNVGQSDKNLLKLKETLKSSATGFDVVEGIASDNGQRIGIKCKPQAVKHVTLIAYTNNVAPVLVPQMATISEVADFVIGALDVLSILHAAANPEEINSFFRLVVSKKYRMSQIMTGMFPYFMAWKKGHREFVEGAYPFDGRVVISCDYNDADAWYCDFFSESICNYPYVAGSYCFGSPYYFKYAADNRGFTSLRRKLDQRSLGLVKRLGSGEGGYAHLYVFDDSSAIENPDDLEGEIELSEICTDTLARMITSLESEFADFAKSLGGIFSIGYTPQCLISHLGLTEIDEELGVYGVMETPDSPSLLYSIDKDRFIPKLMETRQRDVECRLVADIVSLYPTRASKAQVKLVDAITSLCCEGKLVDMQQVKLPYVWFEPLRFELETEISRAKAIRTVALSALNAGVSPGTYYGKQANELLRSFQETLTSEFECELSRYKMKSLLVNLYELCSQAEHEYYLHTARYGAFTKLEEGRARNVDNATFDLRENARRRLRVSRLCIEKLLCTGNEGMDVPREDDLAYIVALGDQLLSLCDEADILFFEPEGFGITVDDDYVVTAIESDEKVELSRILRMRQLSDPGHAGNDDTHDLDYIQLAKNAFARDSGIQFDCFIDVLNVLALGMEGKNSSQFVRPNVAELKREELEQLVIDEMEGHYQDADIALCLNLLTVDPSQLCVINDKELNYLPFGRVKDRPNRFELKPIISYQDTVLFSPVSAGMLRRRWVHGFAERFLPVKAGFNSLYGVISQWKKHYEKALEKDTEQVFLVHGFDPKMVYRGIELKKRGSHPQYLGDYDVLAYDVKTEAIWVIECKEYEKVESAYDYMQLQERWFGPKGSLGKFERRIQYVCEHAEQIVGDLTGNHKNEFKVRSVRAYLVCNKLFSNLLGESSFEVITLTELEKVLSDYLYVK